MTKRKPLPKYYRSMCRQLRFILINGFKEERVGMRAVIAGVFRSVVRRLKALQDIS